MNFIAKRNNKNQNICKKRKFLMIKLCSHLKGSDEHTDTGVDEVQWKASGDTLKIQNHQRRLFMPTSVHTYQ
jgi:hypothetical protein